MSAAETLQTIAAALAPLHDDAYSPVRAIATQPVELNEFTRPHWRPDRGTHPHLRHATGARPHQDAAGDHDARHLYGRAARTITGAYDLLVPPAARQRPRGAADTTPPPSDLVGMLAVIHQVLTRWDSQGQRARDLAPVRDDQVRHLEHLAQLVAPWTRTWTPPKGHDICPNPKTRPRCNGHPIHADGLCRSCYDHQRYLTRCADRQAS